MTSPKTHSLSVADGPYRFERLLKSLRWGKAMMMPFKKCPVRGGELVKKEVEKLLRGRGSHRFPNSPG
jgi:hypothetical protein